MNSTVYLGGIFLWLKKGQRFERSHHLAMLEVGDSDEQHRKLHFKLK